MSSLFLIFKRILHAEFIYIAGDIIRILDCRDANWYKGELNYQYGLVPARYLESLDFF